MKNRIATDVISIGISASLVNILASVTAIIANGQLVKYGDMFVAGYGVTSKVLMIITLFGIGVGSGVQPLFGYCYGAKNKKRLMEAIKFSTIFALALCIIAAILCFVFAGPIVDIFLTDAVAYEKGIEFTRILMSTAWLIGAFAICQNTLQAMGAAVPALLASIIRQAVIFIPAMFILQNIFGANGLIWAQPVADVLSLVVVAMMLAAKIGKMES